MKIFRKKCSFNCTIVTTIILLLFFGHQTLYAQDQIPNDDQDLHFEWSRDVYLPVNLYDTFMFSPKYSSAVRYGFCYATPVLLFGWGLAEWSWFSAHGFFMNPLSPLTNNSSSGGADKFGHLLGTYTIKRFSTFMFKSTGSSSFRANIEGAVFAETLQLITEFGDGFSSAHGFDVLDFLFNQVGIMFGLLLDHYPTLDNIFALQWEWVPTRHFRDEFALFSEKMDAFTDYSGQKYFLVVKFAGIPYLSKTPLRYLNFDIGYFANGYHHKDIYRTNSQNIQLGLSINFSIVSGDILPTGYISSSAQSLFNYYHVPWDMSTRVTLTKTREK